jgi:S1-C subfamily serine protease
MAAQDWSIPTALRPNPGMLAFDLKRALSSIVQVKAEIPEDAFTAGILGTERIGNGVVIDKSGLILTVGYLITEAETVWLTDIDDRAVQGHALAYDFETGFGLIQALGRLDLPAIELGNSSEVEVGASVVVAGHGGLRRALGARILAKRLFAGYWEYLLEEAIFTAPSYPVWGGAGLIGEDGRLLGIGSLRIEQMAGRGTPADMNMIVPIDLLKPILSDLRLHGRPSRPPRPWLGMYTVEQQEKLVVAGLADRGPAERAGARLGDVVTVIAGQNVETLADLYRTLWTSGPPGTAIELTVAREDGEHAISVRTADRASFLKRPRLH